MDWKSIAAAITGIAAILQGLGWYNASGKAAEAKSECQVALGYFAEEVNFWRQNVKLLAQEEDDG